MAIKRRNTEKYFDRQLCRTTLCNNAKWIISGGENFVATRRYYAELVAKLASFVEDAANGSEIPFVPRIGLSGKKEYDFSRLAEQYFMSIPDFVTLIGILSTEYRYSEHVDMFAEACRELGVLGETFHWRDIWSASLMLHSNGLPRAEVFNALVAIIRRDWVQNGHRERFRRRVRASVDRCRDYQAYVNAWFEKLALIVVMRLDLYYRKEFQQNNSLDGVIGDLDHLAENFRCNKKVFGGLRGYIEKIEYGAARGFHIHAIFLFDTTSKQARNHVYHAQAIGEYWVNTITKGRGDYWNCNAKALEFESLGIRGVGPVHASDELRRNNLLHHVVSYLCKAEQFIRPKFGQGERLIRRGDWPKPESKKRGAPRKKKDLGEGSSLLGVTPPEPPATPAVPS